MNYLKLLNSETGTRTVFTRDRERKKSYLIGREFQILKTKSSIDLPQYHVSILHIAEAYT